MFYTQSYKHGWIQASHYPGCPPVYAARASYRCLGDYPSEFAAKLAITRDAKRVAARRAQEAADHHASVQSIVGGK